MDGEGEAIERPSEDQHEGCDSLTARLGQLDEHREALQRRVMENDGVLEQLEVSLALIEEWEQERAKRSEELTTRRDQLWECLLALQAERDALKAEEEVLAREAEAMEQERGDLPQRYREAELEGQRLEQELAEANASWRRLAEVAEEFDRLEASPETADESADETETDDEEEYGLRPVRPSMRAEASVGAEVVETDEAVEPGLTPRVDEPSPALYALDAEAGSPDAAVPRPIGANEHTVRLKIEVVDRSGAAARDDETQYDDDDVFELEEVGEEDIEIVPLALVESSRSSAPRRSPPPPPRQASEASAFGH